MYSSTFRVVSCNYRLFSHRFFYGLPFLRLIVYLRACMYVCMNLAGGGGFKSPEQFKLSLPQRTNYLYGRMSKSLPEMYAFTLCMWIKSSASPGIGTPFSYGVPGQANEIVLIEWGNNPIEFIINDKARLVSLTHKRTHSRTLWLRL